MKGSNYAFNFRTLHDETGDYINIDDILFMLQMCYEPYQKARPFMDKLGKVLRELSIDDG